MPILHIPTHFKHRSLVLFLLLTLLLPAGCLWQPKLNDEEQEKPFRIERFDHLQEDFVATGNFATWQRMNTDYPEATRALVENVLQLCSAENEAVDDTLRRYFADSTLVRLRTDVKERFDNLDCYERRLAAAFDKLKAACPEFVVPRVYTQISAFGESIVVGDSLVGISLDKYLGADYPLYRNYFHENQRASMEPQRIVQDCLAFYLTSIYRTPLAEGNNRPSLRNVMLHEGKIYWIVAKLLDEKLINVAACHPKTKQWYVKHEPEVRKTLLQPALLNDTTLNLMQSLIMTATPEPYFKNVHSRGAGLYTGILLVDEYMKKHPDMTLDELLHFTDYAAMI